MMEDKSEKLYFFFNKKKLTKNILKIINLFKEYLFDYCIFIII